MQRSPTRTTTTRTMDQNPSSTLPQNHNNQELGDVLASEFRKVRLPSFWQKNPRLWFVQLESEFTFYRITSDNVKYNAIVRHLDEQTMQAVADVIERPPDEDKYQILKDALIARFSDSEEKRLRLLIAGIELGDKRPSEVSVNSNNWRANALQTTCYKHSGCSAYLRESKKPSQWSRAYRSTNWRNSQTKSLTGTIMR